MDPASPELFGSPPPSPPGTPPHVPGSVGVYAATPPPALSVSAARAADDRSPSLGVPFSVAFEPADGPGANGSGPEQTDGAAENPSCVRETGDPEPIDSVCESLGDTDDEDPELAVLSESNAVPAHALLALGAAPRPPTPAPSDPIARFRACLAVGRPHPKRVKTAEEAQHAHVTPEHGLTKERDFRCWRNYVVFYNGTVIGPSGRVVTGTMTKRGYLQTTGPGRKKLLMHRIVAMAWLAPGKDSDDSTVEVNHVDGNRTNNRVENLELVYSDQHKHADSERRFRAQLNRMKALTFATPPPTHA